MDHVDRARERGAWNGEPRLAVLWEGAEDGLWWWDLARGELRLSGRWREIAGLHGGELGTAPAVWLDRVHPDDVSGLRGAIDACLAGAVPRLDRRFRLRHADGGWRRVSCRGAVSADGRFLGGSLRDVTDLEAADERLYFEFFHDPLTGLANRTLFLDRLGQALQRARRREGEPAAVLYLDLDRFHHVNDSLGVGAGDALLVDVTRRLGRHVRPGDTLARLGGDKFAVLLESVAGADEAVRLAERIDRVLDRPLLLQGYEVFATASIGIALSTDEHLDPEHLLRDATSAMHRAKEDGAVRHELFVPEMNERARERLELEADLRRAIEREQFVLHYQPIISFGTGGLSGFEALVRWRHPERGLLGPDRFVPIAEETGLIVPLGKWVLEEACRQMQSWRRRSGRHHEVAMAVNLSARQFDDPHVVQEVRACLERTGLDPRGLELEMTESVVMARTRENAAKLRALRDLGVRVMIDDFGTGYSCLASLHSFPLDTLKIDRSFVSRMEFEEDKAEIVRILVALAKRLGLEVVAEGVETAEQLTMLRRLDCHYGQGYLFSNAIDGESAGSWLERPPRW